MCIGWAPLVPYTHTRTHKTTHADGGGEADANGRKEQMRCDHSSFICGEWRVPVRYVTPHSLTEYILPEVRVAIDDPNSAFPKAVGVSVCVEMDSCAALLGVKTMVTGVDGAVQVVGVAGGGRVAEDGAGVFVGAARPTLLNDSHVVLTDEHSVLTCDSTALDDSQTLREGDVSHNTLLSCPSSHSEVRVSESQQDIALREEIGNIVDGGEGCRVVDGVLMLEGVAAAVGEVESTVGTSVVNGNASVANVVNSSIVKVNSSVWSGNMGNLSVVGGNTSVLRHNTFNTSVVSAVPFRLKEDWEMEKEEGVEESVVMGLSRDAARRAERRQDEREEVSEEGETLDEDDTMEEVEEEGQIVFSDGIIWRYICTRIHTLSLFLSPSLSHTHATPHI